MPSLSANQTSPVDASVSRDRNAISTAVGVIGFCGAWGVALVLDGGHPEKFWSLPSLLVVLLAPITILLAVYGWAGMLDAASWVIRPTTPCGRADDAVSFFQLAAAFAMGSGFLATLIGLVMVLTRSTIPSQLGPGVALTLLSQLYGVFAAVVCIALAAHIDRRHNGSLNAGFARRIAGVASITTIAGTLTTLLVFAILMLSLAPGL